MGLNHIVNGSPVEVKHIDYGTSVGYTKVGSPTISNGVVSGFSSSDYITIPYNNNNKKEVVFNFTTPSSFNNNNGLYDCYGAYIYLKSNGKMEAMYSSGASNRWKEITGTLQTNTNYFLKIVIDDNAWYSYLSTDGNNYELQLTETQYMIYLFIGQAAKIGKTSYHGYWSSSIDLNKTYIKVNGKLWFYKPCTNYLVKDDKLVFADSGLYLSGPNTYTKVGSPTIADGVASDFSSNNYITLPTFNPGSSTWEIGCKFTTGSSIGNNIIYAFSKASASSNYRYGIAFRTQDNKKFELNFSLDGASWFGNTTPDLIVSTNTTYWTKEYWDGSAFKMDISTDGITYQNIATIASNTPAYSPLELVELGRWRYGGTDNWAWNGSIDLNETYIKVNGDLWFYGKNYASQNIAPVPSGYTYGNTTTSAIGFVDMRTQAFTAAPSGATLGKDE